MHTKLMTQPGLPSDVLAHHQARASARANVGAFQRAWAAAQRAGDELHAVCGSRAESIARKAASAAQDALRSADVAPTSVDPTSGDWCLSAADMRSNLDACTSWGACERVARRIASDRSKPQQQTKSAAREASDSFKRARALLESK
jgi:hypothetical protein